MMKFDHLVAALPLERRLALAYAPASSRAAMLGLLALDAALGTLVQASREPMLAQLRLAWWRDELGKPADRRARGEPVLGLLAGQAGLGQDLSCLVDGWELLVGEERVPKGSFDRFAETRGQACAALARQLGAGEHADGAQLAGYQWALAELSPRLSDPDERASVRSLIDRSAWKAVPLPRRLRPLKVLHGLALRARGDRLLLTRRGDVLAAFRLGLLGI